MGKEERDREHTSCNCCSGRPDFPKEQQELEVWMWVW